MSTFGYAVFIAFAILVNVLSIPFVIAYRVIMGMFAILVFMFCGMLVMVYKFAAWLSRLSRRS